MKVLLVPLALSLVVVVLSTVSHSSASVGLPVVQVVREVPISEEYSTSRTTKVALASAVSSAEDGEGQEKSATSRVAGQTSVTEVLSQAREKANAEDYAQAARILESALQDSRLRQSDREAIEKELVDVLTARRQTIELDSIKRMIDQGHLDDGVAQLLKMLPNASNKHILERIDELLAEAENWWLSPLATIESWVFAASPFILAAIALILFRGSLFVVFCSRRKKWILAELSDSTDRNTSSLIAHYFMHWSQLSAAPVTSGLLLMEASSIPLSPTFSLKGEQYDVAKDLSSVDLKVGGVSIASLAHAFASIRRWLIPQPMEIKGVAYIDEEKRVCARLTTRLPERSKNRYKVSPVVTVSAVASGSSEEAVRRVSEEVTFKMLYALSKEDVTASDSANMLRRGLEGLQSYLTASLPKDGPGPWGALEEARGLFESVRKSSPELLEAHIYEGIALDLLERHDDAAAHFEYVESLTKGATSPDTVKLHEQAVYNGAVAHLRNLYGLSEIDTAIERLQSLLKEGSNLETRPLLALASATLADAWANRTIHWREIDPREVRLSDSTPEDEKLVAIVRAHETKVLDLVSTVNGVLDKVALKGEPAAEGSDRSSEKKGTTDTRLETEQLGQPAVKKGVPDTAPKVQAGDEIGHADAWTPDIQRQVKWAVHNALGDFYLYAATSLMKIDVEKSALFGRYSSIRESVELIEYVEKALSALRTCEMLLPAGVETLSNIGTLYLVRGREIDMPHARQYLQRAISLNAHYEYAYYRLAQSWEQEGWREKVIEVLKFCPVPPKIPSFRSMFKKYFIQPKLEFGSAGEDSRTDN